MTKACPFNEQIECNASDGEKCLTCGFNPYSDRNRQRRRRPLTMQTLKNRLALAQSENMRLNKINEELERQNQALRKLIDG